MHRLQKFFLPNYFSLCYERPITLFCSKSVSGPVQGRPSTYPRGQIELFQVSLIGFKNSFCFRYLAGMILEAWVVELESADSFMYYVYF